MFSIYVHTYVRTYVHVYTVESHYNKITFSECLSIVKYFAFELHYNEFPLYVNQIHTTISLVVLFISSVVVQFNVLAF